ncbi:CBO0543 family protein [Rossellomorea arthrocnemi]
MILAFLLCYALLGWKFGNWKDFYSYYPTLLFFIIGDLLSQYLLYDYSMWQFQTVTALGDHINLNHTIISLSKMVVQYTATIAIFIGRLPSTIRGKVIWVMLWTCIYGVTEGLSHIFGMMTYHNGWHFGWDILFNIMMLTVLIVHHKNPLVGWIISIPIILFLWIYFDVPYSVLK